MRYAGFWPRLWSIIVDIVVMIPLAVVLRSLRGASRSGAVLSAVLGMVIFQSYHVVCIGAWGKTLGKRLAGIVVVARNGNPAGWRRSCLRSAVDIVISTISCIEKIVALAGMSDALYVSATGRARRQLIAAHLPAWDRSLWLLAAAWTCSELFVLLLNREKRAIHDFIAGTVVIHARPERERPLPTSRPLPLRPDGLPPNIGLQRLRHAASPLQPGR